MLPPLGLIPATIGRLLRRLPIAPAFSTTVTNHDGRLLLLSGLALGLLVIVSMSLLALVARLGREELFR